MINDTAYRPEIILPQESAGISRLNELLKSCAKEDILEYFKSFQKELIKLDNPSITFSSTDLEQKANESISGDIKLLGCWVYYPWNKKLIHLPVKEDFVRIRTARNQYKITPEEQLLLSNKKVGIIGLSVGHSIAMNLVLERSIGELRLADFDELELSNLNRIKTNLFSLGLPKVIIAAREIAELDPFINVKCYHEGITDENLDDFLTGDSKLDALIEECDGLHIKILSRKRAKYYGIPVLMETSDRGLIDIERFDLERDRPILHGLIEHLDHDKVKDLKTSEDKIPYLMPMVGLETMSPRLKASALEVGNSIGTWPQLATSVMHGGAILADTYRRMMLGQFSSSGRYIVDPEDTIRDELREVKSEDPKERIRGSLSKKDMIEMKHSVSDVKGKQLKLNVLNQLVEAGGKAPSGGNSQPWKWLYSNSSLYLFLDKSCSDSYMDYRYTASYMALGAAIENVVEKAKSFNCASNIEMFPSEISKDLVARFYFTEAHFEKHFGDAIDLRYTDRRILNKTVISKSDLEKLKKLCNDFPEFRVEFILDANKINSIAEVVSSGDWIRVMNAESHSDFINEEMRWTKDQLDKEKNGIYVEELSLSPNDLAGLYLVKDEKAVSFMLKNNYGQGLKFISKKLVNASSCVITAFSDTNKDLDFINAGRLLERLWLYCTEQGIGFQMVNVPIAFLLRMKRNELTDLDPIFLKEVEEMVDKMSELYDNYKELTDLFTLRLFVADPVKPTSVRRDLKEILEIE